jgi:hypothetical protein
MSCETEQRMAFKWQENGRKMAGKRQAKSK